MLKRISIILGVILLLILVIGGWYVFIREVDPVANELATATPAPDSIIYGLDPSDSTLDFVIPGVPFIGEISGTFDLIGGSLVMQPTGDGKTYDLVVTVVVHGESVEAGSPAANQAIITAFQSDKFPCGVYTGIGDVTFEDATELVQLTIVGDLEISGEISEDEDFATEFQVFEDGSAVSTATFNLSLDSFGVPLEDLQGTLNINAHRDINPDDADLAVCAIEDASGEDGDADTDTDE